MVSTSERMGGKSALALIISDWQDNTEHGIWDVTNEMQMSKACIIVSKKRRRNSTTSTGVCAKQARAWDISSRAHSCADAATGAGATDSAGAGGNGLSESSGNVVSLCASALSRTGLVAVFAGDCDRDWWVECEEACGMLRFDIKTR